MDGLNVEAQHIPYVLAHHDSADGIDNGMNLGYVYDIPAHCLRCGTPASMPHLVISLRQSSQKRDSCQKHHHHQQQQQQQLLQASAPAASSSRAMMFEASCNS